MNETDKENLINIIKSQDPCDYLPFKYGECYDGWNIAVDRIIEIIKNFK